MAGKYFVYLTLCVILVGAQEEYTDDDSDVVCPTDYTWENDICTPDGPDVGEPTCPDDYWWSGRQCQKFETLCPIGYDKNSDTGECDIPLDVKTEVLTCPSGYYYKVENNLCYPNNPCPDGLNFTDGRCEVQSEIYDLGAPTICPAGYTFNKLTSRCEISIIYDVSGGTPMCQAGYTYNQFTGSCETSVTSDADPLCLKGRLVNGMCVYQQTQLPTCPPGYSFENGQCVRKRYVAATACPDGFVLEGNVCKGVQEVSPTCPYNTELRGDECIRIVSAQPTCDFGYVYQNGQCRRSTTTVPTCPSDFELIAGNCVKISEPDCPSGYEFDGRKCVRKVVIELECPSGYTLQLNQMCSLIETRTPTCPPDAELNGRYCLYYEYIRFVCPEGYQFINNTCERSFTEPPSCPPEYRFNHEGKCEKVLIYIPPVATIPPPLQLTCPTIGPIPACPTCNQPKCETTSCRQNCPIASPPQVVMPPINNYVYNNNTIHSPINVASTNVNTITIGTTSNCKRGSRIVQTQEGSSVLVHQECIEDEELKNEKIQVKTEDRQVKTEENEEEEEEEPRSRCCTVVGPRQCQRGGDAWNCFRRRHYRCGEFCTRDTVYLQPRRPTYRRNMYMMPMYMRRYQAYDDYDMSSSMQYSQNNGCASCIRSYARCPAGCYQNGCRGESCEDMDQY